MVRLRVTKLGSCTRPLCEVRQSVLARPKAPPFLRQHESCRPRPFCIPGYSGLPRVFFSPGLKCFSSGSVRLRSAIRTAESALECVPPGAKLIGHLHTSGKPVIALHRQNMQKSGGREQRSECGARQPSLMLCCTTSLPRCLCTSSSPASRIEHGRESLLMAA